MASIHGFVFVIIGLAVAITSKIINTQTNGSSMTAFFYVGIVMAVYGLLKAFIFRKGKTKTEKRMMYQNQVPHAPTQNFRYCPSCNTPVSLNANFCYKCGARVKS